VQRGRNIFAIRQSPFFRGLISIVTVLLITVKLTSPFLHTHQFSETSAEMVSISSQHCDACEYEATQAIESGTAVILPSDYFSYETKVCDAASVFVSVVHSSSESRGPPQNS